MAKYSIANSIFEIWLWLQNDLNCSFNDNLFKIIIYPFISFLCSFWLFYALFDGKEKEETG